MTAQSVLLVTGMAGAGKTTVLKTLEDMGWDVVDNLPLSFLDRLLTAPADAADPPAPLALGLGTRTRDFAADALMHRIDRLRARAGPEIGTLFLDCSTDELARRYAETRHRHPLATDRPARDGIGRERQLLAPLRAWANRLIDTSALKPGELAQQVRATFGREHGGGETVLTVQSFGFSRGVPHGVDLMFDVRFLRNPHWVPALRPATGLDPAVAAYIADDPAYEEAIGRIEELLLLLLPRYHAEGKPYVSVAFGCTGGKHRSVHVAERVAKRLRGARFSPTVLHRDLAAAPQDALEGRPLGQ